MDINRIRWRLGSFGVWMVPGVLLATPVAEQRIQFARIEGLGYSSLWSGEPSARSAVGGREVFAEHGLMLAATEQIIVGTGIANITRRDPMAMHTAAATLAEAYPERFILGLGGQTGDRPLSQLSDYLEEMDAAAVQALPGIEYPRLLAALGPKAHHLAVHRADGVHPYMQPVGHTAVARSLLGPAPLLVAHQYLLIESDAEAARNKLRSFFGSPESLPSGFYRNNYRRLGFTEADLSGGLSDRFVDALLAWGNPDRIAQHLREHLQVGGDHVLLQPLAHDLRAAVDQLELLAPLLMEP